MSTNINIGHYDFVVEPFYVDYTGHLSLCELGTRLLQCADIHANDRSFGIGSLNQLKCTWVLSRLIFDLKTLPKTNEKYSINTWIVNVGNIFTERAFEILNEQNEIIGKVSSVWAVIDLNTRKSVNLYEHYGEQMDKFICDKEFSIKKAPRVRIKATEPLSNSTVKYSDVDINGHMNSVKYIENILDLFSIDHFSDYRVNHFEITYANECYYGDELVYYMQEVGQSNPESSNSENSNSQSSNSENSNAEKQNHTYVVEVKKSTGEVISKSNIEFTPFK